MLPEALRAKNFLVAGVARNCGKTIEADVARMLSALKSFQNVQWLVIESDSNDETVEKLKTLASEIKNFRFISLGVLRDKMPLRTERIAYCRNKYIEELKDNPLYSDIDYVIVADLDGLNTLITQQAFLSCWSRDDWDVCTANQQGPYYDIWALRHPVWCANDCWSHYKFLLKNRVPVEKALFAATHSKMITIPDNADWIAVDSAYGGLAIYRRKVIEEAKYCGLNDMGEELCEHVPLHSVLRSKNYRIFINPKFINAAYTDHTQCFELLAQLKQKPANLLKSQLIRIFGTGVFERIKKMMPAWALKIINVHLINAYQKQYKGLSLKQVFTKIYEDEVWGKSTDPEQTFYSGLGSHDANIVNTYIKAIETFLPSLEKKPNAVDLGCGDFYVGSRIRHLCDRYIACDIVERIIKQNKQKYEHNDVDFRVLDFTEDELPEGDVVFLRQVLQHLSNHQISSVLRRITGKYKYLILTEHLPDSESFAHNIDKPAGPDIRLGFNSGIVLTNPPFNLRVQKDIILSEYHGAGGIIRTNLYQFTV